MIKFQAHENRKKKFIQQKYFIYHEKLLYSQKITSKPISMQYKDTFLTFFPKMIQLQ